MMSFLRRAILGTTTPALAVLCLGMAVAVRGAGIEASLDRNPISMGDTATLTLTITGNSVNRAPSIPQIPGLAMRQSGQDQQVSIVNGQMTQSYVVQIALTSSRVGNYNIPAISGVVDGQTVSTKPLRLSVVQNIAPSKHGTGIAFVEIWTPKTNLYFGEVMRVEARCYFQDGENIEQPVLDSDGFSLGQVVNPPNSQAPPRETINGVGYFMYVFPVAVTAAKTGNLTLGPATWELNVPSGPQTIFGRRMQHLAVNSDPVVCVGKALPQTNAPGFTGAVGTFVLADFDANPKTLAVGDPITLKFHISGHGAFDNVLLPASQPGWGQFKTYPPTSKFESSDPLQIEGSKAFEQVISPQNADIKEIPAFSFTFFDPDQGVYRTISHAPIPIVVKPSAATPQPTIISTGAPPADEQPSREIVHIKPFFGRAVSGGPPLVLQPWFWAVQGAAPALWLTALVWRRRKDRLANNPRLRRERQVARVVAEGLTQLHHCAAAGDRENFYAGVFHVLQEQIGERLDLPASAITEAALDDLPGLGLDADSQARLQELFLACNQYRYAPARTAQELASLLPKVKAALASLRKLKAAKAPAKSAAIVGCLLLLALAPALRAQPADAFSQANKLFEQGKYADAEAAYHRLLQARQISEAVYFNLGNASFKAGHVGRAILAYRQAENITPRDPDVRANLNFARDQVANYAAALPGNRWTRWAGRLTLDEWAVMASASVALFFLVLAARQIRPPRTSGRAAPALLGLLACALLACLWLAIDQRLIEKSGVVTVSEAVARHVPLDDAEPSFTLHDGAEILALDQAGAWVEVADAAGHSGWLPQKDLAFVP